MSVVESLRVKWSFGYGNRQSVPTGVIASQRSAVSTATPTGVDPSQIVGSRFSFLRAAPALPPFDVAIPSSFVSMQLWTQRRPRSLSFSFFVAFLPGFSLTLTFLVIRLSFSPWWAMTRSFAFAAPPFGRAETFTRPDSISFAWEVPPSLTLTLARFAAAPAGEANAPNAATASRATSANAVLACPTELPLIGLTAVSPPRSTRWRL